MPRPRKHTQSPQRENTHTTQEASPPPPPSTAEHHTEHNTPASPRKKHTPSKSPLPPRYPTESLYSAPKSKHERTNRRLEFSPDQSSSPHDDFPSPALPALKELFSPPRNTEKNREVVCISSSPAPIPEKEFEPDMAGVNTSPRRKTPRKPAAVRDDTSDVQTAVHDVLEPKDLGAEPVVSGKAPERKKYIMLRESLPGGWKEVGEEEMAVPKGRRGRAWRVSEVEVLDMTGV